MADLNRRELLLSSAVLAAPNLGWASQEPTPGAAELRFRQVHLDFHTSEHVEGIAAQFDPDEFARTLERARVNSVTCFARCHHGWIYYDTKANPERRHPHLKRNLLKEQIEACHRRNIRVPIYVTIQWDHYTAQRHADWLVVDEKGAPVGTPIFEPGFYRRLCYNTPYREFLRRHVTEICAMFDVDGFFFDIVHDMPCACFHCRELMRKKGIDPTNAEQRWRFAHQTMLDWQAEMTALVRQYHPRATIFYNAGHVGPRHRRMAPAFTHWELESLPSGGWGYLDFPLKIRYTRTLGLDSLGMTGKFHTSWGDFHSLKNRAALEFECFQMLALGAKCSVGDQLHPAGRLDEATYDLIGAVYRQVEAKEPWCRGARAVTDVGVLTPEEFYIGPDRRIPPACFGFTRMLGELKVQFDVLDSKSDFSPYRVLVLPDRIEVDDELARKIDGYVSRGGSLLASCASGLDPKGERFLLDCLGLDYLGEADYSPDFLVIDGPLAEGLPKTELVMYMRGKKVRPRTGAQVLMETHVPYFNRTWDHFFSHRHTPSAGRPGGPGIVQNGRCIYFMHPVFEQYHANAPLWVKRLVGNALRRLLPDPVLDVKAPSSVLAAVNEQPGENRWVVHLLHYIPERRGQAFDVIEDVIPVANIDVGVKTPRTVRRAALVPEGRALEARREGAYTVFRLPVLEGHQMIALEF
ncbi:MAG: beta-galactosidase trimerization domain-containing protein [Bryobacteraceae bacterium]